MAIRAKLDGRRETWVFLALQRFVSTKKGTFPSVYQHRGAQREKSIPINNRTYSPIHALHSSVYLTTGQKHTLEHAALTCARGGRSTWTSTRSSVPETRCRDCCIRQGGCPNLPRSTRCHCPRDYRWSRHARSRPRGRRSGRKGPC